MSHKSASISGQQDRRRKIPHSTVLLGACVYYARAMPCESRQFHTIFFAEQLFIMSSISYFVNLDRLITLGCHDELARVIVIEAKNVGSWTTIFWLGSLEELQRGLSAIEERKQLLQEIPTLVGLKSPIISATLEVLATLLPRVRVMLRVVGVLAGDEFSILSISMGVDAMVEVASCFSKGTMQ